LTEGNLPQILRFFNFIELPLLHLQKVIHLSAMEKLQKPQNTPPFLNPNDTILLCGSARFTTTKVIAIFEQFCRENNWVPEVDLTILKAHHQFAGSDEERTEAVQKALKRDDIKAIIFARGGYGTIRIMDKLELQELQDHPKWLIGFSDLTYLLNPLAKTNACIHGPMALQLQDHPKSTELLSQFLKGEKSSWSCATQAQDWSLDEAQWIGGNLSIIYAMLATPFFHIPENAVLFLEDLDEYLYHIDRMMASLYHGGVLHKVKAVMAGSFSDMRDHDIPFGLDASEILNYWCGKAGVLVIENLPFGHEKTNSPIIMGKSSQIKIKNHEFSVNWE
jgi:muramoyltetrapeptide carboxypeptidase